MSKYPSFGISLKWDPAGGTSYATIGQIQDITGPGISRNPIDGTTHDSPNAWMQFFKGLKDGGEVGFDIVYDPALGSHNADTGVISDFEEDTIIPNFQVVFPDAAQTTWTFPGFLQEFEPQGPLDEMLAASVSVKVAGKPTLS